MNYLTYSYLTTWYLTWISLGFSFFCCLKKLLELTFVADIYIYILVGFWSDKQLLFECFNSWWMFLRTTIQQSELTTRIVQMAKGNPLNAGYVGSFWYLVSCEDRLWWMSYFQSHTENILCQNIDWRTRYCRQNQQFTFTRCARNS